MNQSICDDTPMEINYSQNSTIRDAASFESPKWFHISELYIPMLPFCLDPNWIEVKIRVEMTLKILRDKTRTAPVNKRLLTVSKNFKRPKPPLSESQIRSTVLGLMQEVADLDINTTDQMVWLIQFMCRFYLQKYKPEPYLYLPQIMEMIQDWDPDLWDDEQHLSQIATKIDLTIGTNLINFNYVYDQLAFSNVYLLHIFTSICCVKMREIILDEYVRDYAPITPKQVLSLANTFNLKDRKIALKGFKNFITVFALYLRLVTSFIRTSATGKKKINSMEEKIPEKLLEKYYKPSVDTMKRFEHWTENAIKLVDVELGHNCTSEMIQIREILDFDVLATIQGRHRKTRSALWSSQNWSQRLSQSFIKPPSTC